MVGIRTSNRCDNCRRRKKKCGEQKPSCLECIRAGWACPGYTTQWKFVNETRRITEHYAARKYAFDSSDLGWEDVGSRYSDREMSRQGMMMVWHSNSSQHVSNLGNGSNQMRVLSKVPRYHDTNRLGSALVYCLEIKAKGPLVPLHIVGSFFQFLPARLGHNIALDNAVSCLSEIYCGSPLVSHSSHRSICKAYVRALSSLRVYLSDTSLKLEPDTLCASILLQMCELAINVDRGEWSHLARGTSYLLYSRGVHRYTSAFEHAMLESQLPFILSQSMSSNRHCFLRSPEWQALLGQSPIWPFQITEPQSLSLRSRLCGALAELPSLIIHCSKLNENKIGQTEREDHPELLISKTLKMLDDVKKCLPVDAELPFLSYPLSSDQVVLEQISYPDILAGVMDCVANTALLSIDKILRFLCHEKLQLSSSVSRSGQHGLENSPILECSDIINQRRQRATMALRFVQGESKLAAKPLEFGVAQIQSDGHSISTI